MADERRDRHLGRRTTVRLPDDLKANALEVLATHGWTLNDIFVACLRAVIRTPRKLLALLAEHRPTPRRGRPRKDS